MTDPNRTNTEVTDATTNTVTQTADREESRTDHPIIWENIQGQFLAECSWGEALGQYEIRLIGRDACHLYFFDYRTGQEMVGPQLKAYWTTQALRWDESQEPLIMMVPDYLGMLTVAKRICEWHRRHGLRWPSANDNPEQFRYFGTTLYS